MNQWQITELERIATTDDLHVSPFRQDGRTLGTPTWIWSVVVDGSLYARPYKGKSSRWYQAAMQQGAGQITAAGMTKDVIFVETADSPQAVIDQAYRKKYANSPYLSPMIGERAQAATVRIDPR